jgi:hypothetical protein
VPEESEQNAWNKAYKPIQLGTVPVQIRKHKVATNSRSQRQEKQKGKGSRNTMNKKTGAAPATPSQTETSSYNCSDHYNCQVLADTGEATPVWEESLLFTLPNHQIGDVKTPGAIIGGSVRSLPLRVSHSDHKCQQAWRDKTHAVYKHFGSHGQFIGWEAILIKVSPTGRVFGKDYPEREVYPSNEDFGRYALSVGAQYDLQYAIEKAKTLKIKNVAGRTGKPPTGTDGGTLELKQTEPQTQTQLKLKDEILSSLR